MQKEQLTFSEHPSSPPLFIWGWCSSIFNIPRNIISIIDCLFVFVLFWFVFCFVLFCFIVLATAFSVLFRITTSGYTCDIFAFFLLITTILWTNNHLARVSIGTIERIVPLRPSSAVMPQSITYQRQNIGSKTSTEKLQGNSHHLLVHAQHIHYQYNMEQELLTFESTWFVDCCVLQLFSYRSGSTPFLNRVRFAHSSILCVVFQDHC